MTKSTVSPVDFPAYSIYRPYDGRKFKHGEVIGIPYETSRHGTLVKFFTLGTVAGYALQYGEDPIPAIEKATERGHKLYWANANAVTIHNGPVTKEEVAGFNYGDTIILQGHLFTIEKAPNQNVELKPVGEIA